MQRHNNSVANWHSDRLLASKPWMYAAGKREKSGVTGRSARSRSYQSVYTHQAMSAVSTAYDLRSHAHQKKCLQFVEIQHDEGQYITMSGKNGQCKTSSAACQYMHYINYNTWYWQNTSLYTLNWSSSTGLKRLFVAGRPLMYAKTSGATFKARTVFWWLCLGSSSLLEAVGLVDMSGAGRVASNSWERVIISTNTMHLFALPTDTWTQAVESHGHRKTFIHHWHHLLRKEKRKVHYSAIITEAS